MPSPTDNVPFSKACTLWVHDEAFSTEPVLLNPDLFPNASLRVGCILVVLPQADTSPRRKTDSRSDAYGNSASRLDSHPPATAAAAAAAAALNLQADALPYVFIFREFDQNERFKTRNLQLSVSRDVAAVHGFYPRMSVCIAEADKDQHAATHVELTFSDPLNRADLWKLTISELSRRECVYQGQELLFLNSIKIYVKKLFVAGRRAPSALFTKHSRPVFRSTSARFILGIQVSREMLQFDDELSGAVLWAKAADFVSTLLKRWKTKGTQHMLSVLLFTRLFSHRPASEMPSPHVDLYRVVASDLPAFDTAHIMRNLEKSFRSFVNDIRLQTLFQSAEPSSTPEKTVAYARHGNLLEAINLSISACWLDDMDLDFERTGTSLVVLTPGSGSFHVDESLLRITGERLSGRSIGVELVCLSALPLHVVPLFIIRATSTRSTAGSQVVEQSASVDNVSKPNASSLPDFSPSSTMFVVPSWIETSFYQDLDAIGQSVDKEPSPEAHRLIGIAKVGKGIAKDFKLMSVRLTVYMESPVTNLYYRSITRRATVEPSEGMDKYDVDVFTNNRREDEDEYTNQAASRHQKVARPPPAPLATPNTVEQGLHRPPSSNSLALGASSRIRGNTSRLSSLLGHTAFGKVDAITSSSTEQASSTQGRKTSQQFKYSPNTVSSQVQSSLSRPSSALTVPSLASSPSNYTSAKPVSPQPQTPSHSREISQDSSDLRAARGSPKNKSHDARTGLRLPKSRNRNSTSNAALHNALPWRVIQNPCRAESEALDAYGEWNHAFTSERKAYAVKWKALCTPASLPLTTEHFPSASDLQSSFTMNPYRVSLSVTSNDEQDITRRRGNLAREMVLYRISDGFQIAVGARAAKIIGPQAANAADFYADDFMSEDGATVMMLKSDNIQILCAAGDEVSVTRYHRKSTLPKPIIHHALLRTFLDRTYYPRRLSFSVPSDRNWSKQDNDIAEVEADSYERQMPMPTNISHPRQARFVLIPSGPPTSSKLAHPVNEESEEELRLDGIRKLTMLWQKNRWVSPEDEKHHASWAGHKDINPLAIEYQTRDPSEIVAAGFESSILTEGENATAMTHLFDEEEQYRTSHVDLQKLAAHLQSDRGIHVRPRRWHLKLYEYCFVGHDLISFLLARFQDVRTREEAAEFGNMLMSKGLFHHVNRKHKFRDGNYFFAISRDYRAPRADPKSSWFGIRKALSSVPATPLADGPKEFPDAASSQSRGFLPKRPKVVISGSIQYNVDPRHISTRPEIITIHYDKLHNPDNAFHFMLEWTNATAKLVEDALTSWAGHVSRYGLKLLQLPIAEVVVTPHVNPLRSPYVIEMALKSAPAPLISAIDSPLLKPQKTSSAKYFQKELLKKFNFILDFEASSSFPPDVDVGYSFGQEEFQYDQYVHRSGLILAEIIDDWKFIILANRLYNNRASTYRADRSTVGELLSRVTSAGMPRQSSGATLSTMTGANLSPVVSPQSELHSRAQLFAGATKSQASVGSKGRVAEAVIKDELEDFCNDSSALQAFYEEVGQKTPAKSSPALSVLSPAATPSLQASIPSLDLPDRLDNESTAL